MLPNSESSWLFLDWEVTFLTPLKSFTLSTTLNLLDPGFVRIENGIWERAGAGAKLICQYFWALFQMVLLKGHIILKMS